MTPRWTHGLLRAAAVWAVAATLCAAAGCKADLDVPVPHDATRRVTGEIGVPVDYFGVHVTVLAIEAYDQTTDLFPRFRVSMRSENKRSAPWVNPAVRVSCAESDERGEWYKGSTWESDGILPRGAVNEGQVIVGFPRKKNTDLYPVATCTDAAIVVTGTDPLDRRRTLAAVYPLDPTMVRDAIDAPRI